MKSQCSKWNAPQKLAGLVALLLGFAVLATGSARADLPSNDLVKALQSGGYVVYMRHTKTNKTQEDLDHSDLSNCSTQRNLSEEGREQARVIGDAFKTLKIKVNSVVTSPYCRAKDTSSIAFGGAEVDMVLGYLSHQPEVQRPISMASINRMLGTPPPNGTINILVSHTENLKQTTGIWPKDSGVMHIFKPKSDGGYTHVGKIDPGEWVDLVRMNSPEEERSCLWILCW